MPNKRMEGVPWPRRELADMELCEGTKGCLEPRWLYCQLPGASRDVIMHLPSLGSKYLEGGTCRQEGIVGCGESCEPCDCDGLRAAPPGLYLAFLTTTSACGFSLAVEGVLE